jgi:hypothetical protein
MKVMSGELRELECKDSYYSIFGAKNEGAPSISDGTYLGVSA